MTASADNLQVSRAVVGVSVVAMVEQKRVRDLPSAPLACVRPRPHTLPPTATEPRSIGRRLPFVLMVRVLLPTYTCRDLRQPLHVFGIREATLPCLCPHLRRPRCGGFRARCLRPLTPVEPWSIDAGCRFGHLSSVFRGSRVGLRARATRLRFLALGFPTRRAWDFRARHSMLQSGDILP